MWSNDNEQDKYSNEYIESQEKFQILRDGIIQHHNEYNLKSLIYESNKNNNWIEPEWGFPKGRRNLNESDIDCALREFTEETGYKGHHLTLIDNLMPFEEIFSGSNYKSYKHRYYLMCMKNNSITSYKNYDKSEVSKIEWKTYEECLESIRNYNLEKKQVITNVNYCISNYMYS